MKKRFFALLLVLALLPASVSGVRATGLACFVGVNNTLTALSGSGMPYYENGVLYIPYTAFHAEPGGVFVAYDEAGKTLALSQIYVRLIYDLAAGTVTDETGNAQSVSVSYRDGLLYIPATQAASHFGLSVTLLESQSGCSIIRFTDGSQTMDDAEFVVRSETLISIILENNGQQPEGEDPENPGPDDGPDGENPAQEQPATVYLAFTGEAVSTATLGHLRALELQATFFLTQAQLLDNVELARSIYAEGHRWSRARKTWKRRWRKPMKPWTRQCLPVRSLRCCRRMRRSLRATGSSGSRKPCQPRRTSRRNRRSRSC